jgi:hypothetical protein
MVNGRRRPLRSERVSGDIERSEGWSLYICDMEPRS